MKKYSISFSENKVPYQKLAKYQDFEGIIMKQNKLLSKKRMKYKIIMSIIIFMLPVFIAVGYFNPNIFPLFKVLEKEPVTSETMPAAITNNNIKPSEDSITSKISIPIKEVENKVLTAKKEIPNMEEVEIIRDTKTQARPIGGWENLFDYFEKSIKFSEEELNGVKKEIVKVEVWINETGKAERMKVIKGLTPNLDAEAVRAISVMPRWKPATVNGQPYKSRIIMTVNFEIR
ncbi:MAG: energy transducer TonB [Flammeovirgaceae bacterium]|nr:energy transducer TonB [Flammeovirgaceae bacterium]